MTLYRPSDFRVDDRDALAAFIEAHAFGTLVTSGPSGLDVSHIPFLVDRSGDAGVILLGHVARANGQWKALGEARETLAIFQGPHAYVSPSWYEQHPAVPTWNYSVVHAHGRARLLEEPDLRAMLERLSSKYEAGREGAWRMAGVPADFLDRMVRTIVGFAIEVDRLEGKFKLSQNRPREIPRVIAALEAEGEHALAALMREHRPRGKV